MVFSVLEEAATTWASGRAPEKFEGDTARETLYIIISALETGFRDPWKADAARKQLAILGPFGKTWAEYKREFERLCHRGGVPLTTTNHQGFTIPAPANSEACDRWVARLPKETRERMETAFGILSRRPLDFLMEESNIRWPAPEKKLSGRFNRSSTTSSSSSGTTDVADRKVMTQAEREAWIKKKKAEGSWVENPTEEDRARFVKERARKQRESEVEQKKKGGQ